jgi:hypothetical protein
LLIVPPFQFSGLQGCQRELFIAFRILSSFGPRPETDTLFVLQWYFVLAKTDPEGKPSRALSGFIVDADTPGIS